MPRKSASLNKVITPAGDRIADRLELLRDILSLYDSHQKLREWERQTTTQTHSQVLQDVKSLFVDLNLGEGKATAVFVEAAAFEREVQEICSKRNIAIDETKNPTPEQIRIMQETLIKYPNLAKIDIFKELLQDNFNIMSAAIPGKNRRVPLLFSAANKKAEREKKRNQLKLAKAIESLVLHQRLEVYPDQLKNYVKGMKRQAHDEVVILLQDMALANTAKVESASVEIAAKASLQKGQDDVPMAEIVPDAIVVKEAENTKVENGENTPVAQAPELEKMPPAPKKGRNSAVVAGKSLAFVSALGVMGTIGVATHATKAVGGMAEGIAVMLNGNDDRKGNANKGELHLLVKFIRLMNWAVGSILGGVWKVAEYSAKQSVTSPQQLEYATSFGKSKPVVAAKAKVAAAVSEPVMAKDDGMKATLTASPDLYIAKS